MTVDRAAGGDDRVAEGAVFEGKSFMKKDEQKVVELSSKEKSG